MPEPVGRPRPKPTFHRATVVDAIQLTPRMRRITLTGSDLAGYPNEGPATHFKLVLPPPGQTEAVLPSRGPNGVEWPDGARPVLRTYTPRSVSDGSVVIDFALHADPGPASRWAQSAQPGDSVVITGARGAYRVDPTADYTVLVADETALPAASTIIEDAPAGALIRLFAEIPERAEQLDFETQADLTVTWLPRDAAGGAFRAADAVLAAALPEGRGAFWVGLEAGEMRRVRRHLLGERGVDRAAVYTRAYWKRGVANHPDHDSGEDD
jgi:NADPH-dependent ferric siderophore reductase